MSMIDKQLADLLSTQPKKRPPRAPGENAKPGQGVDPSVASLMSLLKGPGGSGDASGEKAKPAADEKAQPPENKSASEGDISKTAALITASPEVQVPPALQAPALPVIQPPAPAMQAAPAMQPPAPAMQPPPPAMQPPSPQKKERPDIKIALQSTVTGAVSPFAKTPLPFIKGLPDSPPPPSASAIAETPAAPPKHRPDLGEKPKNLAGTVTATVSPFARAPLPFAKTPAGQSPPPAAQPPAEASPKPPPDDLNATALGSISPFASPLPFGAGASIRDPGPSKEAAPSPPAVQSPKPSRLDRTADEVVSPFKSKALPFQPQQPQQPPAAPSPPAGPPAIEPIPPSTPSSSRGAPVSARPPTSAPSSALQASSLTRGLSIEQYASLCAELATYPAQTEQVFLRYHLVSAQDRAAVDTEWRARLAKDPAEYKRWHELYWHYCTYLKQRR